MFQINHQVSLDLTMAGEGVQGVMRTPPKTAKPGKDIISLKVSPVFGAVDVKKLVVGIMFSDTDGLVDKEPVINPPALDQRNKTGY